jgi:RimJ/RimL family protein N-acetyltransferase
MRPPEERDIDAIVRICGDWSVASGLAFVPHPYGAEDARFFLDEVVPKGWVWAIQERGANDLIGVVGLAPEQGTDKVELGYWLSPLHWHRGIATEAARAAIDFGFSTLNLAHIKSGYFESNPASGRVLEKIGFVEICRATRPCLAAKSEVASVEVFLANNTKP